MDRALLLVLVFAAISTSGGSSETGRLLVANKGDHTLGIIEAAQGREVATIPESGITGHEVAASADGKLAFVPIYGNSGVGQPGTDGRTIDVIDLQQRRVIHTIDFGHGVRPHCALLGPTDGMLYVTTELDNAIAVVDPRSFTVVGSIPTGQAESHMLAISPDGRYGYTANVGPGTVSVVDMASRKTVTVIAVANHVQRISVSGDGRWVFTSDTEKPRLAVIDAKAQKVQRWIELPGQGYGTASTPDGKWLLVAMPDANGVGVLDLASWQVVKTINVPPAPQEVLIPGPGGVAYVSCDRSKQVAAIQTSNWSVQLIAAGRSADGLAWAR
jgi:DNA-binding beta-propeller fold protein YncE